jgi:O-glycosyl hydrolase
MLPARVGQGPARPVHGAPPSGAAIVDDTSPQQTIDGFGGSGAFQPNGGWPTASADHLFGNLGLNIYRSELSTQFTPSIQGFSLSDNPTNGAGDFSAEGQFYSYGGRHFLLSVWINAVDTTGGPWPWNSGGENSVLDSGHYADACTAITTWCTNLINALGPGCQIYISPANEPDITPGYAQTSWSTSLLVAFVKNNLGPAIATWAAANPTQLKPKLVVNETANWSAFSTWVAAFEADSTALAFVDYYATHQYSSGAVSSPPSTISKPIWETECSGQDGFDSSMSNGMTVAGWIHNALTTGNARAWLWWVFESDNDSTNGGLIGSTSTPAILTKRSYVLGHWSKFVLPGSTRIAVTNSPSGVNVTAFRRSDNKLVIVAVNTNGSGTAVTFSMTAIGESSVTPWITDASNNLAVQTAIAVEDDHFSTTLGANSVTTFLGA